MRRPRRRLRSGIKVQFHRNEIIDFEPVNVRELLESGGIRPLEFKFEQMAREFRLTEKVVASLRETDLVTPKAIVNVGIKGLRKIDGIGKATAERLLGFAINHIEPEKPESEPIDDTEDDQVTTAEEVTSNVVPEPSEESVVEQPTVDGEDEQLDEQPEDEPELVVEPELEPIEG